MTGTRIWLGQPMNSAYFVHWKEFIIRTTVVQNYDLLSRRTGLLEWFYLTRETISYSYCLIVKSKRTKTMDLAYTSA